MTDQNCEEERLKLLADLLRENGLDLESARAAAHREDRSGPAAARREELLKPPALKIASQA
jgi:hypothetical protein